MFSPSVSSPLTLRPGSAWNRGILLHEARGLRLELVVVLGRPPVAEVPVAVELPAAVVEAVADLVADHRADGAVVRGVVRLHVEVRRLQERGREHDLVVGRQVIGIDRLRRHEPLGRVLRLARARGLPGPLELVRAHHVADEVAGADLEARVVAPLVRVGDLDVDLLELRVRLGLGRRAHPVEPVDAAVELGEQVVDERHHPRFRFRREVARDVGGADRLAHRIVGFLHAALPARAQRLGAAERARIEVERGLDEAAGSSRA